MTLGVLRDDGGGHGSLVRGNHDVRKIASTSSNTGMEQFNCYWQANSTMIHRPDSTAGRAPRLHFLVAEDGAMNRHLALALLRRAGHRVTFAHNGAHAVDHLRQNRFDVVLMDIDMPVMDGITATRAIRDWEKTTGGHTPVIALTSNSNRDECLAAGMDGFLSKPLKLNALHGVLDSVLPDYTS